MKSLSSLKPNCLVVGASGGLGGAVAKQLDALVGPERVLRVQRRSGSAEAGDTVSGLDYYSPDSIKATAESCIEKFPSIDVLLICSGTLQPDGETKPERALRELDPTLATHLYTVNCVGPLQLLAHLSSALAPHSSVTNVSARVGSISDNRLGGWHGYRMSKAAANQGFRTASRELVRTRKSLVWSYHPGTVNTPLSRPFTSEKAREEGTKVLPAAEAAARLVGLVDKALGEARDRDGAELSKSPFHGGFFDHRWDPVEY